MAKGKSNNFGKLPSAPSKSRPSSSSEDRSSATATKPAPKGQREISPIEIGHAAGEIWALLSSDGEQTLATLKKSVDAPAEIVLAAIGWLAREDKLEFTTSGRTVKISLR